MSYLDEVLKSLGWQDGFQIPVANCENQELEKEVARLTLQKVKAKGAFETSNQKLENLQSHLKYVKQESEENQNLITAHAQELQNEEHKLRVDLAERDKFEQEIRSFVKKQADVKERQSSKKSQLQRLAQKLEKLRAETNWDAEALKAWEESLQKRDDDNEVIKKFSKEDEKKYNELEAKRQSLEVEFANRKQLVEKMVSEIDNYERMLERTGKAMQQQNEERNALIKQWKDAVKILQSRDHDIDLMQTQIVEMQEIVEKEKEKLQDQNAFYQNEIRNNDELEFETRQLNSLNSRLRREQNDLIQYIYLLNNQADALRRTLINTTNHLQKERNTRKCLSAEIYGLEQRNRKQAKKLQEMRDKYQNILHSSTSVEEHARQMQKLFDQELILSKNLQNENEMLQSQYVRYQRDLQDLLIVQKVKDLEIYGAQTNISHLRKHADDKRKMIEKLKEDAYDLDFKIDDVHKRIMVSENVYYGDDKELLEAKLLELDTKRGEHADVRNLLKEQVHKIRDDMRRLTSAIVNDQNQLVDLENKLQNQMVNFEGGNKQLETMKTTFREKQVEENILRLRVNHLDKSMKNEEKSIYTLRRFKLSLEQATQERMLEINTDREILLVKRRNLVEDKGRLKCDQSECRIRLEQFQKKYDIILNSLGRDENGQTFTVTHFKIRNAQEKFILQQEGDALDSKIKTAEKEIVAMENTLKVINLTNSAFKQSLGVVEDEGDEAREMKGLESEIAAMNDCLKLRRKDITKKRQELDVLRQQLVELDQAEQKEREDFAILEEEFVKIEMERGAKDEKYRRAEKCLKMAQKKVSYTEMDKYNRDLEIRQLKEANSTVLQKITEMSEAYQETTPLITRYASEYNIDLVKKKRVSRTESVKSLTCSEKSNKSGNGNHPETGSKTSTPLSKVSIQFDL